MRKKALVILWDSRSTLPYTCSPSITLPRVSLGIHRLYILHVKNDRLNYSFQDFRDIEVVQSSEVLMRSERIKVDEIDQKENGSMLPRLFTTYIQRMV